MRLHDGKYECLLCGKVVDIPSDREPHVVMKASGGAPTLRTIVSEGREVHACPVGRPDPTARTRAD